MCHLTNNYSVNQTMCLLQDLVNDYSCQCGYAYTGLICDDVIDFCDTNPCQNGGTCNVRQHTQCYIQTSSVSYLLQGFLGGFACHCVPGWYGDTCQVDTNECGSDPCANMATCHVSVSHSYIPLGPTASSSLWHATGFAEFIHV